MLSRAILLAVAVAAACTRSAAPGERCAALDAKSDRELSRAAGCQRIRGDLRVHGAVTSLAPLAALEVVDGDVAIGPAIDLSSLRGLERLRDIGGALDVTGNPFASGIFLGALGRVGGDVRVTRNLSATVVSLHALHTVGGDLILDRQPSVRRVDLSALDRVGGDVLLRDHGVLETLVVPAAAHIGGTIELCVDPGVDRAAWPEPWASAGCNASANPRAPGLDSGAAVR